MSEQPLHEFIDLEAYDVVPASQYRELKEQFERLEREYGIETTRLLRERTSVEERYRTLEFAAMRLCNVHKWSYGGPETLEALAERIAGES